MRILSLIAVVLFVSSLAAPARAGMGEDCNQDYDRGLNISGCTALILSGQLSVRNLVIVYNRRGLAYADLGKYHQAIEDYDQTLRLDPGYARAYSNRAIAHCHLEQFDASLDDWMQALRFGALTAKALQSALRDRGFYKGAIDGDFGPASRNALSDWTVAGCPGG